MMPHAAYLDCRAQYLVCDGNSLPNPVTLVLWRFLCQGRRVGAVAAASKSIEMVQFQAA